MCNLVIVCRRDHATNISTNAEFKPNSSPDLSPSSGPTAPITTSTSRTSNQPPDGNVTVKTETEQRHEGEQKRSGRSWRVYTALVLTWNLLIPCNHVSCLWSNRNWTQTLERDEPNPSCKSKSAYTYIGNWCTCDFRLRVMHSIMALVWFGFEQCEQAPLYGSWDNPNPRITLGLGLS